VSTQINNLLSHGFYALLRFLGSKRRAGLLRSLIELEFRQHPIGHVRGKAQSPIPEDPSYEMDTGPLDDLIKRHGKGAIAKYLGLPANLLSWPLPGHFYSPYPDIPMVRSRWGTIFCQPHESAAAVDERIEHQLALAQQLEPFLQDFPYTLSADESEVKGTLDGRPLRYRCNAQYQTFPLDAVLLSGMLRFFQPRRVIEVGSGCSSAIMLDVRESQRWIDQELTFIEPYAQHYFYSLIRKEDRDCIRLLETPLWDVDDSVFASLQAGDLLFIDSSHVAKIGSDVYEYLFRIFPRLASGVLIHIHDITPNYEIAPAWFERGWYWNEGAFLRAFLMYNDAFEVTFHSSLLFRRFPDSPGIQVLREHAANTFARPEWQWTNSFYLRRN
jgi:hypothetical protein